MNWPAVTWLSLAIATGLISGFLFGTQPSVNGYLARQLGHPLQASIVSFLTGSAILIGMGIAVGVFPFRLHASMTQWPWWCWGGGAIGVLLVTSSLIFVPRIGSLPWHATIITGQLLAALILDHYGLLGNSQEPMSKTRLVGAVLLATGVVLIFWAKTAPVPLANTVAPSTTVPTTAAPTTNSVDLRRT